MTGVFNEDGKVELLRHFDEIVSMALTAEQWAERESSDMFQSEHFSGGFDATEMEFLFSYYPAEGGEFWFGVSLDDVQKAVSSRQLPSIDMRLAD
jgi:hypothetical protein